MDAHGVYRVGGSRVTLDLWFAHSIAAPGRKRLYRISRRCSCPTSNQVIGYYLKHSAELAEYFEKREREEKELLAAHP